MIIITMSNFGDMPKCRPIDKIDDKVEQLKSIMNTIKFDVSVIKSDLDIIKKLLKERPTEEISRGWFY